MARGFESKDVEFQQTEAARTKSLRRALSPEEREHAARRATIELALARARGDLAASRSTIHQRMLKQAIQALETELSSHE
jgi:hypothetical protein